MQVTNVTLYGVLVLQELAKAGDHPLRNEDLAQRLDMGFAYAAKVTHALKKAKWVTATKGTGSGYRLRVPLEKIKAKAYVETMEGVLRKKKGDNGSLETMRSRLAKWIGAGLDHATLAELAQT